MDDALSPSTDHGADMEPSATSASSGLNWNLGNRASIRTSLSRRRTSGPANPEDVVSPLQDDSSSQGTVRSPLEKRVSVPFAESRARNLTASLDDLFSRDRSAQAAAISAKDIDTRNAEEAGKPSLRNELPPLMAISPPSLETAASPHEEDLDDESEDLYGETPQSGSEQPPQQSTDVGSHPQYAESEDDSDILQLHTDDELDQGVMINISENNALQPGAWYNHQNDSDRLRSVSYSGNRDQLQRPSSSEEGEVRSASPDAMMRYADAKATPSVSTEYQPPEPDSLREYEPQVPGPPTAEYYSNPLLSTLSTQQRPQHFAASHQSPAPSQSLFTTNISNGPDVNQIDEPPIDPSSYLPPCASSSLTLADLTDEQLGFQLNYFYVGRDPVTIPLSDSVRCEICMRTGHQSEMCMVRCCTCCKAKDHIRANCPSLVPCSRCQLLGHRDEACTSVLRAHPDEQRRTLCRLCQHHGHSEVDCEVLWRSSSPYPWMADLPIGTFRAECYECGRAGHLGNDCPTRRPGKVQGTMSWSAKARSNPPYRAHGLSTQHRIRPPDALKPRPGRAKANANGTSKKKQFRYRSPLPQATAPARRRSRSPARSVSYSPPPVVPSQGVHRGQPPSNGRPAARAKASSRRGRGGGPARGKIQIRAPSSAQDLGPPPPVPPMPLTHQLPHHPHLPPPPPQQQQQQQPNVGKGNGLQGKEPGNSAGGVSKKTRKKAKRADKKAGGSGGQSSGNPGGRSGAGGAGGEKYKPMPGSAAKAWRKGFT